MQDQVSSMSSQTHVNKIKQHQIYTAGWHQVSGCTVNNSESSLILCHFHQPSSAESNICLCPVVMRSWRTIRLCCTCPSPLKSRILKKTPSAPHPTPRSRLLLQRRRCLAATRSSGSLHLKARPKRKPAPPPSNCRGCPVTVREKDTRIKCENCRKLKAVAGEQEYFYLLRWWSRKLTITLCPLSPQRCTPCWAWKGMASPRRRQRVGLKAPKVKTKTSPSDPSPTGANGPPSPWKPWAALARELELEEE